MKFKKDLSKIREALAWLGFDNTNGSYNIMVGVFMVISLFLTVNSIIEVLVNWTDTNIRVDCLKGIFVYSSFGVCLSAIAFDWNNVIFLIQMIENRYYIYRFRISQQRTQLQGKVEDTIITIHSVYYLVQSLYVASEIFPPIIVFLYRFSYTNIHDFTADIVFTAHRFYYPKACPWYIAYVVAFILQSAFSFYFAKAAYIIVGTACMSMYQLAGEMRLLALTLQEMDTVIMEHNHYYINMNSVHNFEVMDDSHVLRQYLEHLVKHHQHIGWMAKRVQRGIQLVALYLNSGFAVVMVTTTYVMVQRDDPLAKLQEVLTCLATLLCSYLYNAMGQEIINQDENLRSALYESKWMDKPQWFRKSIHIMMTRATRPIEMKPVGLFILDLQNFLKVLKAMYTLFNMLNYFKGTEK